MPENFDPDAAQERLDELGEDIAQARRETADDVEPAEDDDRTYVDSGATPEEDDQTIVPPG